MSSGSGAAGATSSSFTATAGPSSTTDGSRVIVDPDHDDWETEDFGQSASASDAQTITALVKRYYVGAVAGDGVLACSMLLSSLAKSIPEAYGGAAAPAGLRGTTCPQVMSKFFEQQHNMLAAEVPTMVVRRVRVKADQGLVFLRFKTTPEPRDIGVKLEHGNWKVTGLLDASLP